MIPNPFASRRREEPEEVVPPVLIRDLPRPAPPVQRSIVGAAVMSLHRGLIANRDIAQTLRAEIDAKTEAHRQTTAVVRSIELALVEMINDDALTEDERALISEIYERKVEDTIKAAEAEINA